MDVLLLLSRNFDISAVERVLEDTSPLFVSSSNIDAFGRTVASNATKFVNDVESAAVALSVIFGIPIAVPAMNAVAS
eukprot:CAMPEP_0194418878 /NCGR_PEP_ID=MMETSP0176-20130528/18066_1 /TAXON_ID=216777 /ORGANISM="Proboscia alata, Strain PI-D3" /LENGTH=76 /DNA_ID=CAMNT_0039225605 /DNA_START=49 /DNA_END=275 /DNA_ORIENTATION=-